MIQNSVSPGAFLEVTDFLLCTGLEPSQLHIPDTIIKQSRQHEGRPVLLVPGPHHPLSRLRGDLHTGHQGVPGVAVLLSECIPLPRQVCLVSNEAYHIITIISGE